MIVIPLTQGKFAKLDSEDYDIIKNYSWYYSNGYAYTNITLPNDKQTTLRMHRLIMGLTDPKIQCDHINHDELDNRRINLRQCTNQENNRNRNCNKNSTSKYKGVCWYKRDNKWRSSIKFNNKQIHLGYFYDENEAAIAYNNKSKELFGEFANLNIID
jgi:hypothetical protein